jgi:hypothetical protein
MWNCPFHVVFVISTPPKQKARRLLDGPHLPIAELLRRAQSSAHSIEGAASGLERRNKDHDHKLCGDTPSVKFYALPA